MEDNWGRQWLPHLLIDGTMDATGSIPMVSIGIPIFGTRSTRLGGAANNDQESNDNATKELCNVMQSEDF